MLNTYELKIIPNPQRTKIRSRYLFVEHVFCFKALGEMFSM